MKLKIKKIIAREFITFIILLLLASGCFLFTFLQNYYKKDKIENLTKIVAEKSKALDSLSKSYKIKTEKRNWFFKQFTLEFPSDPKYYTQEKVWNRLDDLAKKDSIKYKWEKEWDKELIEYQKKIGFSTPDSFKKFIESNRLSKMDSINHDESNIIFQEINSLNMQKREIKAKILSMNEQVRFGIKSAIIFAALLFGLRYIFYGFRWSIKILKQKNES